MWNLSGKTDSLGQRLSWKANRSRTCPKISHILWSPEFHYCVCRIFPILSQQGLYVVEASWNVMAHAQKPDFAFRRNGRVHLNLRGRQFSRLLAAELCASAVVMLDSPYSGVVWRVLATHSIRHFPFTSPPVRHRVPSLFNWTLPERCAATTERCSCLSQCLGEGSQ
jgi:hypothetical protein